MDIGTTSTEFSSFLDNFSLGLKKGGLSHQNNNYYAGDLY